MVAICTFVFSLEILTRFTDDHSLKVIGSGCSLLCPGDYVTAKSSIQLLCLFCFFLVLGGSLYVNIDQQMIYCKTLAEVYSEVILVAYFRCRFQTCILLCLNCNQAVQVEQIATILPSGLENVQFYPLNCIF